MYTKKILSMAAAIALLSTASLAFEMNTDGEITVDGKGISSYTGGSPVPLENSDLNLSSNLYGDALIYPYFKATKGWETEIVVRNTTPHATVAKVSVYAKGVSDDIGDFNVYLSPYDVIRFTIKDGRVFTADASIPTQVRNPKYGPKQDEAKWLEFNGNSEELEVLKLKADTDEFKEGYVVVYGMTQYHDVNKEGERLDSHESASYGQVTSDLNYHQKHDELFKDYRRLMDACRPGWRKAFNTNGMKNGTMMVRRVDDNSKYNGVPAPDTNIGAECVSQYNNNHPTDKIQSIFEDYDDASKKDEYHYNLEYFGDVDANTFTGTVRVYKEDGQQSRDLLLPAAAISNLSIDNMYLWAEGEWASLADRRMIENIEEKQLRDEDGNLKKDDDGKVKTKTIHSYFDKDTRELVLRDSNTFMVQTALYTFNSKAGAAVTNQILVTQPTKKILGQLFGTPEDEDYTGYYWEPTTTHQYGGFKLDYFLLDEDEGADVVDPGFTRITSPAGNMGVTPTWDDEMQKITSSDLEDLAQDDAFKNNDGYTYLVFKGAESNTRGIPAIVTEMSATKVGGFAQTNWIYAPTTK